MRSISSTSTARAPRWAGYLAALFGLEYAVAKAVMAGRGELGVPGHPAPPEAYERFSGDVVAAQLGNAATGLVCAAIALALVQRWGRRIPAAALAAGAGAALLAGLAGVVVVAASLAGLREDHGQWGIDSLVLGAAPLAAWLVLTVAAARAARAEGRPGVRRAVAALLRPGHRAALAAAGACVAYGSLKLHWALGGELLMRETPLPAAARRDLLEHSSGAVAGHWASVALAAAGVAVAVASVRGGRLPRLLTVGLPALLGGLMLLRAGWGIASDAAVLTGIAGGSKHLAGWDLGLWSPFFAAWGAAWSLTALAARRRAGERVTRPRRRRLHVGHVTAAWGVVFAVVHAYWAVGGEAWMNGDAADTPAAQIYIGFIAVLGLAGAAVAHGLAHGWGARLGRRKLILLARAGAIALALGVAMGTGRWIAEGGLDGDGAAGVITTLYFLLGAALFATLARRGVGASL